MGQLMRRLIDFACEGAACAATLDDAAGTTGLLVVSGGNEIRIGAHRGMARLARDIAAAGHPVFRFDRRGIGDSQGENHGFRSSAADIAAAISAFRAAQPQLARLVAFGNCDAATALVLHRPAVDSLVLANPWVVAPKDDLPPPAAIKDRYARRLRDPAAWAALLTGKINIASVARGLGRIATPSKPGELSSEVAEAMTSHRLPTHILLASGDGTALAFADAWKGDAFAAARAHADVSVETLDSLSHSFANEADYAALKAALLRALAA
jgi:exosortase A-associated hydrolase 1